MNKRIAAVLLVIAAAMYGVAGAYSRVLKDAGLTSGQIAFFFMAITTLVLFVGILVFDRDSFRIQKRHLILFVIMGVSEGLMDLTNVISQNSNALSLSTCLQMTAPFFVVIIAAILFKERISLGIVLTIGLYIMGAILISGINPHHGIEADWGVAAGLTSGLMLAIEVVVTRLLLKEGYGPITVLFYAFVIGTVVIVPFTGFNGISAAVSAEPTIVLFLVAMAFFCKLVPNSMENYSAKYFRPLTITLFLSLELIFSSIVGALMFHEDLIVQNYIGIIMVMASVVLVIMIKEKQLIYRDAPETDD